MAKFKTLDIVKCTTQPPTAYRIALSDVFRVHRTKLGKNGDRIEVVRVPADGGPEALVTAPHPEAGDVAVWADEQWFEHG